MRTTLWIPAAAALAAGLVLAVETRTWTQDSPADYEKATLKRVALSSDGRLTLAPAMEELLDASAMYLWAVAVDSKGNRYAGGGAPGASAAKLYRIDAQGASRVLAELAGMEIHAIALDLRDRVYAATSPDGKVYRVSGDGKSEVFYDPKAKYIWAMAFDRRGELFVGTGDQGEIHRVAPDGKGQVWFRTEEAHARSLAVDSGGNLIVGTEPGGLVLRITPAGEGFVLHQASKREVTAVAAAVDGSVYAAAVGARQPAAAPGGAPPPIAPVPTPSMPAPVGAGPQAMRAQPALPPPSLGVGAPALIGGSEVWRIDRDGFPRKVWNDAQDIVYAVAVDARGLAWIGTGNRGRIYRLDSDIRSTLLATAEPTQVTALASAPDGSVCAATANVGKLLRWGPGLAADGVVESDPLDAGFFSYWGRLRLAADSNGGGLAVETRSGNLDRPQKNWSAWAAVPVAGDSGRVASPPARFLQWKLTLKASPAGRSPEVRVVETAYLAKNVAPVIEEIEITPPNYRFPAQTLTLTPSQTLTLPPMGKKRRTAAPTLSTDTGSTSMQAARGWIAARWMARDDNGDALAAKIEIRGRNETEWKLLKDKVREKHFSWDTAPFPDGEYRLRVTVSDAPDNPAGAALEVRLESDLFTIDNTPPEIIGLSAAVGGNRLTVTWKARDALNIVETAEYSIDGGDWTPVLPVTRLADSRELDYRLEIDRPAPGEHTIAVRVADEYENQRVEKLVVR